MLVPGVPRGAASSRWLAGRMSAQFLLSWIGGLALMALFGALAEHLEHGVCARTVGSGRDIMVLATLPLVACQWRRWAGMPPPTAVAFAGQRTAGSRSPNRA
jgi:hypothetical protein